ncbi:MAG TPA: PAS domain-containing protein, partial [Polyangiaceae bacterium]|nr:PAS domain-containing protein [Polyangiaceae bacterium]
MTKRRWRTAVFDHASEAIFVVDEKLRVVDANQAACDLWATGYGDLLGRQLAGLEHALFGRMGDSTITVDHSFVRPDGTPVLTELRAVPRYLDGLHLLVFRDIAESRSTEQRLRMMSRALEETADLVLITDRDGVIVYVNAAWEALTGFSSSEVLGSTPAILRSGQHQDSFYADLWATIARGEVFRGELHNVAKDGSAFLEEKIITSLRDPSGQITHYVSIG